MRTKYALHSDICYSEKNVNEIAIEIAAASAPTNAKAVNHSLTAETRSAKKIRTSAERNPYRDSWVGLTTVTMLVAIVPNFLSLQEIVPS